MSAASYIPDAYSLNFTRDSLSTTKASGQNSDTLTINNLQNEQVHHFGVNRPSLTHEIRNLHKNGISHDEGNYTSKKT